MSVIVVKIVETKNKKIMMTLIIIAGIIEILYKPRLDKTSEGNMLLWYGRKTRNYIVLW